MPSSLPNTLALLLLSIVGGGWGDLGQVLFRGVLLALAVLLGGLIWASVVDPNRPEAVASGTAVKFAGVVHHHGNLDETICAIKKFGAIGNVIVGSEPGVELVGLDGRRRSMDGHRPQPLAAGTAVGPPARPPWVWQRGRWDS
mgnify:CR=1 FL=1